MNKFNTKYAKMNKFNKNVKKRENSVDWIKIVVFLQRKNQINQ